MEAASPTHCDKKEERSLLSNFHAIRYEFTARFTVITQDSAQILASEDRVYVLHEDGIAFVWEGYCIENFHLIETKIWCFFS